ncbi:MAG TPA: PVC-type heme-binding CxxCH protein [Verrucomicrobiae bacterium]|nr:PVC-type heme-binding CxxCH protein [Verrucomicrobiae bacterium]
MEKRFPPLQVPPRFHATLFACDPLIEYPSVLAPGPRTNSIFLAHDYMTGLGEKIVRKDEVRLVEDTNGDGYADKSTVWAGDFNSIQGLAYQDGRVFVMHSPLLTVLRDTDGDGVADERRDVLRGLGWPPEKAADRLHGANGVAVGHDGWLYLAVGDRGCDVTRPEGDQFVLHGGGILRCRPDGTDLHIFATGLRNIYDVALDEELNVFVRDNENDGGNYLIRVCHSFFGADHGYPYLYQEHPAEALAPMAEFGRGSSAGGVVYLEPAFPDPYQGGLFFCEWGKSVVFYPRVHQGAGFAPVKETEFATGAATDPYGFKPTDVIVDRDGSLLVSDWADGQRPKRGRGRVYRIRYQDPASTDQTRPPLPLSGLNEAGRLSSPSYLERVDAQLALERRGRAAVDSLDLSQLNKWGRLHAVWLIARADGLDRLFEIAAKDPEMPVRVQAVRAIGDLSDPILVKHRLEASRGDPAIARGLAGLAARGVAEEPRLKLELCVALGRLRWPDAPAWLRTNLGAADPTLQHAAVQTLRRSQNWPAVLQWLDIQNDSPLRSIAVRALAEQAEAEVVDGLIQRLETATDPSQRREYAELLSRVHRKPGPWTYWGFRPEPRPPNTIAWEKSASIETALDRRLVDPDRDVRLAVLQRLSRENIAAQPATLLRWLSDERKPERVAAILSALNGPPAEAVRDVVERILCDRAHATSNRLAALSILLRDADGDRAERLLEIARALEESPVLAETLRQLGASHGSNNAPLLLANLQAASAEVRIAAIDALAAAGGSDRFSPDVLAQLQASFLRLLGDANAPVRAATARAIGQLHLGAAADRLLECSGDVDPLVRRRSLEALVQLRDERAVTPAVRALERDDNELLTALKCLAELGGPAQAEAVTVAASRSRSTEILQLAAWLVSKWNQRPDLARIEGASGVLLAWMAKGPLPKEQAAAIVDSISQHSTSIANDWRLALATNVDSRVSLESGPADTVWIALSEFAMSAACRAEFRLSSNGTLDVWLNGKHVHHRTEAGRYATDSDRFEAELIPGMNRLVTQVSVPTTGAVEVHARFRRKSAIERHEQLAQLALTTRGNPDRGREIFLQTQKTGCLTCHRLNNQGGVIGPDLTGVGRRFARIHLIESILEPSRAIAPAFRNLLVRLKDAQELTGVRIAENDSVLTLGDAEGQSHSLKKDQIEETRVLELSIMPEGLENALTDAEFVDLIAFLSEQK